MQRASDLSNRLTRSGADAASGAPSTVDLSVVVGETVEMLRHHPEARGRTLRTDLSPTSMSAFPVLVQQIAMNLVVNALEASPEGGSVLVRVARGAREARIEIHDDGPGVPEDARASLFEAFFTTKAAGTGLGLVSARQCAEPHGGTITIERSTELGGACFTAHLPLG